MTTKDYMEVRAENLGEQLFRAATNRNPNRLQPADDWCERVNSLRCLSRDVLLRLITNPEMVDAPAGALASRSVVLAECLLAELGKVEKGEFVTEEENMKQGTLFGLFRQWYYKNREQPEAVQAPETQP